MPDGADEEAPVAGASPLSAAASSSALRSELISATRDSVSSRRRSLLGGVKAAPTAMAGSAVGLIASAMASRARVGSEFERDGGNSRHERKVAS
jgi:hypothetical protein